MRDRMSLLFAPVTIGKLELKNRFVRSATHDGCADTAGMVTDDTVRLYEDLAWGGVGLIVSGYAYVLGSGQNYDHQLAAAGDEHLRGLRRLPEAVHRHGAKVLLQVVHCGRNSRAVRKRGEIPVAPSAVAADQTGRGGCRELTEAGIEEIVAAFGEAATRARSAGFDGVQLHAAHSYLFSQFLSPAANRRTDRWGGDLQGRLRFHREVVQRIRTAVGDDFPLLMKFGVQDSVAEGLTLAEGCEAARMLAEAGVDAIEVSEGMEQAPANHIKTGIAAGEKEAYYRAWAKNVKASAGVPVILVGGLRSTEVMEGAIREGDADLVAMCRPFIREPSLVHRWQGGDRSPATCISCNLCLKKVGQEEPLACMQAALQAGN